MYGIKSQLHQNTNSAQVPLQKKTRERYYQRTSIKWKFNFINSLTLIIIFYHSSMNVTSSLTSSLRAKLKATRAFTQSPNDQLTLIGDRSRLRTSIHTIAVKESPNKNIAPTIGLGQQFLNHIHTPKKLMDRRHSPISKIVQIQSMPIRQRLRVSQSVSQLNSTQGIQVTQNKQQGSRSRQRSEKSPIQPFETITSDSLSKPRTSIKPRLSQDRHFVKVKVTQQNRRLSSTKMLPAPPSMENLINSTKHTFTTQQSSTLTHNTTNKPSIYKIISPSKQQQTHVHITKTPVLKQISHNRIPRQVELERKIKVLEIRVGELHLEKGVMETRMNELIIRLQHENNFLKEKLNSYPSLTQIGPIKTGSDNGTLAQGISQLKVIDQVMSQRSENTLFFTCPIKPTTRRSIENGLSSDSSRSHMQKRGPLNIQFVDSQEHYYNNKAECQQIVGLKQKLLEVEEMLSKEVGKNLKLLEEMEKGGMVQDEREVEIKRLMIVIDELRCQNQTLNNTLTQERQAQKTNEQITRLTHIISQLQSLPQQNSVLTSTQLAHESARITHEFQDKILSLEMEISWLNQKLKQLNETDSQVRPVLSNQSPTGRAELIDHQLETDYGKAELKQQLETLRAQYLDFQHQTVQVKAQLQKSTQENHQLKTQIANLEQTIAHLNCRMNDSLQTFIPEQVIQEQRQTNQILMSTIRSLEKSLALSDDSIHDLMNQKIQLESKLHEMELQLNNFAYKEQQYELELQTIGKKLYEISDLVEEKRKEVEDLHKKTYEQQYLIEEKQQTILQLKVSIETLQKEREDSKAASTQNSYYEKSLNCNKWVEMRNDLASHSPHLAHLQSEPKSTTLSSASFMSS